MERCDGPREEALLACDFCKPIRPGDTGSCDSLRIVKTTAWEVTDSVSSACESRQTVVAFLAASQLGAITTRSHPNVVPG